MLGQLSRQTSQCDFRACCASMHGPSWMVRWAGSHSPAVGVAQAQLSVFLVFSWKIYEDIDRILKGY